MPCPAMTLNFTTQGDHYSITDHSTILLRRLMGFSCSCNNPFCITNKSRLLLHNVSAHHGLKMHLDSKH